MFDDTTAIRHDEAMIRPVLRIAVPAWAPRFGKTTTTMTTGSGAPTREDFKRLLDAALNPSDRICRRLTRGERKQIAVTRKLRSALYGNRDFA